MTILRKRVQHDGLELDDPDAIVPIAERVTTNVRALQGALIRVVAFHSLTGRPIDRALVDRRARRALSRRRRRRGRSPVEEIQAATCERLGISPEALALADRSAASPGPARSRCTSRAS